MCYTINMNYKTCKRLNENFVLDENFDLFLAKRDPATNAVTQRFAVENPMEKGYIYACLYFHDEVAKEIDKLHNMINRMLEEINMEVHIPESSKKLMELSARVRQAVGDDSLDAIIKEILAKEERAIALMPDQAELEKLDKIFESIFTELFESFSMVTLRNTKDEAGFKIFRFTEDYIRSLSDRQKKLLAPAIRMVGFKNMIRLNDFEILPDWSVRYRPERLEEDFTQKEDEIKAAIKKMMEQHLL